MVCYGKRLFVKSFLYFSAVNLAVYILYHLSYNLMFESAGIYIEHIRTYLSSLWEFAMFCLAAVLMYLEFSYRGVRSAFLLGITVSASALFYSLPYYYIQLVTYGFTTAEAIPYSVLIGIGTVAINYLHLSVLFGIGILVLRHTAGKNRAPLRDTMREEISKRGYFDSALLPVRVIFFTCLGEFVYQTVSELVRTVEFFTEYGTDVTEAELFTLVFNYLFIILSLVLSHIASVFLKDKLLITEENCDGQDEKA